MSARMTAEDILPLIAGLAPDERVRLLGLVEQMSPRDEASAYAAMPPRLDEFFSDDDALAWDADGWEDFD